MNNENLSSIFIGSDTLLIECADIWRSQGHSIAAVVTSARRVSHWARALGVTVIDADGDYGAQLASMQFDYLFAITHLAVIPDAVIALPKRAAINFHDGPLPKYAGLNAPTWALINRERSYGITWHTITAKIDAGDVLKQAPLEISDDETSLSLNTRCFALAMETFADLTKELATSSTQSTPQTSEGRTYFGRFARPEAACVIDWNAPATTTAALTRALDFGPRYPNSLGAAMLSANGRVLVVVRAEALAESHGEAATVVNADDSAITVACGEGALVIRAMRDLQGRDVELSRALTLLGVSVGGRLDQVGSDARAELTAADKLLAKAEPFWTQRLLELDPVELPYARSAAADAESSYRDQALDVPAAFSAAFAGDSALVAAFAVYLGRLSDKSLVSLAYSDQALAGTSPALSSLVAKVVPLVVETDAANLSDVIARVDAERAGLTKRGSHLLNLGARFPDLAGSAVVNDAGLLAVGVALGVSQAAGSIVQLAVDGSAARLRFDPTRLDATDATRMATEFSGFLANLANANSAPLEQVALLTPQALQEQLVTWNQTDAALPEPACIHTLIEAQVDVTPDVIAVACENDALTYRQLDEAANRLANHLRAAGVGPDQPVGIHIERSINLVVATLAVLKAGGAYVPLDPTYPTERIALMIEDAHLKVVVTQQGLVAGLAPYGVTTLALDSQGDVLAQQSASRPERNVQPSNLAYLIYTSGSTGRPKGVMLEHRHAVNFFVGMDARVPREAQGNTWLAVTSLSFDISVLELLWTLARGFKVVVHADRARAAATASRHAGTAGNNKPLDFSLFYFAADAAAEGSERYRLLLEGAKFADTHGFSAVWTPERHFHAFGGLYPNPAVTGAAVAAITKNIGIRAGSVVLPLHHPARVVEAWSIVDNISNGRVGVSMASGWQPNDFILMPANYKNAKAIMMSNIEVVRRLWRGEAVSFPGHDGQPVSIQTQPTPVQKELPIWITTAGNAETFEMAGKAGANVLTHLLGQSIEKLTPKIEAYRRARAAAGFDPNTGIVSLMLHTFVGADRATTKELAREPLKAYLATSMDLIKDKAWAFPAFARVREEKGTSGGDELASLTDEEREGMLDFAFERYFETSGLFGTPDDALVMVRKLKAIGVTDIACLIDFGVATQVVLDHLPYLDQVRAAEQSAQNVAAPAPEALGMEHPFLTDVREHGVTHMQCTPSMARMFLGNEETRLALEQIKHLFFGGEALPLDLLQELSGVSRATVTNMYGPTETTVWSTTYAVKGGETSIPIGTPIANTSLYVTDSKRRVVPAGVMGELWIGGLGVARGYWERPELTDERFVSDPFTTRSGARMYRTGDRARWRADGVMEFFGRADFQVKVRGYRIEPGEIEARVRKSSNVSECVVVLREDRPGDQRLVGYVVPVPGAKLDATAIREGLRADLPEYMVPSHIVIIDELPLTPNRKVDRKALPLPEQQSAVVASGAGPKPESEVQQQIATVWHDVLARDGIGLDDNFFDLGGHSLLVVRAHRKLQEVLARPLALTDLYRFPTIRSLSGFLEDGATGDSRKASERGARRRELMQRRGR